MNKIVGEGLTFDDVLLVPRLSNIVSRSQVNLTTYLTREIKLNIPILSASMDTVTESKMAIAIAREGGLGVIHRFMPIDRQVEEVAKVKRAENVIIEDPITIRPESKVKEAKRLMEKWGISGLLVVDDHKRLLGIVSRRDVLFENDGKEVREVMTPRAKLIVAEKKIGLEEAKDMFRKYKIEKIPIVDNDDRLIGLITARDVVNRTMNPRALKDSKGRLMVGAAIGVRGDYLERAKKLWKAGVDVIFIDVAHGHSTLVIDAIKKVKAELKEAPVIAGNVATSEGVEDLVKAGADGVKVGVGPGSVCTTRVVTGAGIPQLTAIMECAKAGRKLDVPIIADGGIRKSGDLVKALAAGASSVMIGNLLAGTDESPGPLIFRNGKRYKIYRGMASFYAMLGKEMQERYEVEDLIDMSYKAEGVEAYVPYRGSVREVLEQLISGLRSGMSYCGASNIKELQEKALFIKITHAAYLEGLPHDVEGLT